MQLSVRANEHQTPVHEKIVNQCLILSGGEKKSRKSTRMLKIKVDTNQVRLLEAWLVMVLDNDTDHVSNSISDVDN